MSRAEDLYDRLMRGDFAEVQCFIDEPVTEELFLDYKRSADNGRGSSLHSNDRKNLAKAISGFGNSEGGIIIWGVDCRSDPERGDVPCGLVQLANAGRFKAWLEQHTSGLSIPSHTGVRHHAIAEGIVISLIPGGVHAPYQNAIDQSYYIRSGSNFARAPHAVLAGMFGRRPSPSIKHHYFIPKTPVLMPDHSVRTESGLMLRNFGRGIAQDIFVNIAVTSHPGKSCEINIKPSDDRDTWSGNYILSHQVQLMTRPGVRLAPEGDLMPLSIDMTLKLPIERDFSFQGVCGCSGGEPWRFGFNAAQTDLAAAYEAILKAPPGDEATGLVFNSFVFKTILQQPT